MTVWPGDGCQDDIDSDTTKIIDGIIILGYEIYDLIWRLVSQDSTVEFLFPNKDASFCCEHWNHEFHLKLVVGGIDGYDTIVIW